MLIIWPGLTSYTTSSVSLLLELLPPVSLATGVNIFSNKLWWRIEWIFFCQFAMAWLCDCKVFTPAWGWTSVRPDSVLMMKLILLPQTSSRNPASRILAEAALSSWRRQNFATSADRDTDLQWTFIIRTSGVKLTYSVLFILILVSKITQPRKILHPRLIKYFIPRPG